MPKSELHIVEMSTSAEQRLSGLFKTALHDALADKGQMDAAVYEVEGFCGRKFRLLLNNLVRQLEGDARYLEVGIFKGATLCPVINNNPVRATGIDNWSWDKENTCAATFYNNLAKFKTSRSAVTIMEQDFRKISVNLLGKFNIYFYDGDHAEKDQYDGVAWAVGAMDDTSILLIDDWNWREVRHGTMRALTDLGLGIDFMVELRTSFDNTIPTPAYGNSDWHNGFFGAVISKQV